MLRSEHTETFVKKNINNDDNAAVWEKKLYEVTKNVPIETDDCSGQSKVKKCGKTTKPNGKRSKGNESISEQTAFINKRKKNSERNYWVEYWDNNNSRWICTFFKKLLIN